MESRDYVSLVVQSIHVGLLCILILTQLTILVWIRKRSDVTYLTYKTSRNSLVYLLFGTSISLSLVVLSMLAQSGHWSFLPIGTWNFMDRLIGDTILLSILLWTSKLHMDQMIQVCHKKVRIPSGQACNRCRAVLRFMIMGSWSVAVVKIGMNMFVRYYGIKDRKSTWYQLNAVVSYLWLALCLLNILSVAAIATSFGSIYIVLKRLQSQVFDKRIKNLIYMILFTLPLLSIRIDCAIFERTATNLSFDSKPRLVKATWILLRDRLDYFALVFMTIAISPIMNRASHLGFGGKLHWLFSRNFE